MSNDKLDAQDLRTLTQASEHLYQATRGINILSHIQWSQQVRERFFAQRAERLPEVSYPPFDPSASLVLIDKARSTIAAHSPIAPWLNKQADCIEQSARMLANCGSAAFFTHSSALYGTPTGALAHEPGNVLQLAQKFEASIDRLNHLNLGAPPSACHLAEGVADALTHAVGEMFKHQAPPVILVDELSANVLAGAKQIRVRRGACFTDKDIGQLIQHEAYVHVATALNGRAQSGVRLLGASHPGTTKTQEGLAVFAEFITGCMDLDRMRRLSDRVIAIQMAIEGADFIAVYRFFLDRGVAREQAYENSRRVFRGGTLSGGAPFTKDIVYLDGLIRVHNFLAMAAAKGRADCIELLFCGKLDIEDLPLLKQLSLAGLVQRPAFIPPWAQDLRYLLCYLTYASFISDIDHGQINAHYDDLLNSIPAPSLRDA